MKVFRKTADSTINEPLVTDGIVTFVHLSTRYCCLLTGDHMPEGTSGLVEVDLSDPEAKADVAACMLSVGSLESFTDVQSGIYADLTAPTLEDAKADAMERVKARHADMLCLVTGRYSPQERDTWPLQMIWADRFNASSDPGAEACLSGMLPPDLRAQLQADGHNPAQHMADRITAKVSLAERATMIANRTKNDCYDRIEAAQSLAELETVMAALPDLETAALDEFNAGA